jgi:hypothetical protein
MVALRGVSCRLCDPKGEGEEMTCLDELNQHLEDLHSLSMCRLCLSHRRVFPREQELMTGEQLTGDFISFHGRTAGACNGSVQICPMLKPIHAYMHTV